MGSDRHRPDVLQRITLKPDRLSVSNIQCVHTPPKSPTTPFEPSRVQVQRRTVDSISHELARF
jgi:hypothetical protein